MKRSRHQEPVVRWITPCYCFIKSSAETGPNPQRQRKDGMAYDILITDDSRVARAMIKKAMPPGEYAIREAGSGTECLTMYGEKPADAILLDLTMPEMDGFETLERLKQIDPDVQVVVITADIQPGARERAKALGALAVLNKPPKPNELETVLDRILT